MFLKKKAHNLFAKSAKLALRNIKSSIVVTDNKKNEKVLDTVSNIEDVTKPKRVYKQKKSDDTVVVEGE